MAGRLLCGQGAGKPAVFKSRATPADAGADADLAGGPARLASGQRAAHRGQPAKNRQAQPVAQELAAAGAGNWSMSVHNSAISTSLRQVAETGLPYFVQALTFFGLFCFFIWVAGPSRRGARFSLDISCSARNTDNLERRHVAGLQPPNVPSRQHAGAPDPSV
jgi:hypothetical protein